MRIDFVLVLYFNTLPFFFCFFQKQHTSTKSQQTDQVSEGSTTEVSEGSTTGDYDGSSHPSTSGKHDDGHATEGDHVHYDDPFQKCYSQLRAEKDHWTTQRLICFKCYVKADRVRGGDAVGNITDFNIGTYESPHEKR